MPFNFAQSFFKMCQKFPQRPALFAQQKHYTYQELYQAVASIYNLLVLKKVKEKVLGVYTFNDLQTAASILAISAYGSAYVPINPKFPIERNKFIIEDCKLQSILSSVELPQYPCQIIRTDEALLERPLQYGLAELVNQDLAYILYTSGSTGIPKGVPVSNENVGELFNYFLHHYDFNETDRFLQNFEWTFDASVWSFFLPLITGGCTYLLPNENIKFVAILKAIKEHQITSVLLVPSVLSLGQKYLQELHFPHMRFCVFGGEALPHSLVNQWKKVCPNCQMENHYGLTEAAVHISRYIWEEEQSALEGKNNIVPIGKIYENNDFLILDENGADCPIGIPGELCLAGPQIVNHYVNHVQPERFFDRMEKGENKHYFRTGDWVQINERGNLLYLGRNDEQVQIQGHRVELKEIEFELKKLVNGPAALIVQEDELKRKTLIAFIERNNLKEADLKEELAKQLGFYMIPKKIIALSALPMSFNGKIDKKVLKQLLAKN